MGLLETLAKLAGVKGDSDISPEEQEAARKRLKKRATDNADSGFMGLTGKSAEAARKFDKDKDGE